MQNGHESIADSPTKQQRNIHTTWPRGQAFLASKRAAEIDAVFARALDHPTGPLRQAYLETACDGDEKLRREVEALLAAAVETDALLSPGGAVTPASSLQRLGPYQLVEEIGRGGMGVVYLAARVDGHYEQLAAVKLLRLGADHRSLARFHRERQILAHLEHPSIARLYDGGTTPQGDPYLVMEYVQGQPIHRYCSAHGLSLRRRIELFVAVCEAVQAAHRQLVVHHDIKPSNILVDGEGRVKLLDFGIATLVGEEHGATATTRPMTPQYASPEQIENRTTTVSSDVYQLGLLAYELLTGQRPYELDASSAWRWKQQICDTPPPPPSTAVGASLATHAPIGAVELKGDLDAIVLKALRKEPERRYGSVDLLRQDLEHYLEGRPVSARPDTWPYRLGKFVGRHRMSVTATVLVVAAFLTLTVAFVERLRDERNRTRLAAERAVEERIRAERHSEDAEKTISFLVDLFDLSDPFATDGEPPTTLELLDRGAERLGRELGSQPRVRVRLLNNLGRIFDHLGRLDRARELATEALSIQQSTPEIAPEAVVGSLKILARSDLRAGDLDQARSRLEEALARVESGSRNDPLEVAALSAQLGGVELQQGDYAACEAYYRRAYDLYASLQGEESVTAATMLQNLGIVHLDLGKWDEAQELFERTLAIYEKTMRKGHPRLAEVLNNLGVLYAQRGDHQKAVARWERALGVMQDALGAEHPKLFYPFLNLALGHTELGHYDEADRWLGRAVALGQSMPGPAHPREALLFDARGKILIGRGRPDEAEPWIQKALDLLRAHLPAQRFRYALTLNGLGEVRLAQGRDQEAEKLFEESLSQLEGALGLEGSFVDIPALHLAGLLSKSGRKAEAESLYRKGLALRAAGMPATCAKRREAARDYATLLRELGRDREARFVEQRLEPPPRT